MSRIILISLIAIAWTAAFTDGFVHLAGGDVVVPVAMVVAGVGYVAIRLTMIRSRAAAEGRAAS